MDKTTEISVGPKTTKTEVLTLRVTKAEREAFEQVAKEQRLTLSNFLARAGLFGVKRAVERPAA
jgi:uncharacterized protein (DUF1778 family)